MISKLNRSNNPPKNGILSPVDFEAQLHLLVNSIRDHAIYTIDTTGTIVSWNAGAERIKGYRAGEIIGRHFSLFYTDLDRSREMPMKSLEIAADKGCLEAQGRRVRKDGTEFWAEVVIQPIYGEDGDVIGFAKVTRDITERRQNVERLHRLAHFDLLTGLPNRVTVRNRLENAINAGQPMSIAIADLDGLKDVNDTFGHGEGDRLLQEAARRLHAAIGAPHWLGRLGSDKFVVAIPGELTTEACAALGSRIIEAFSEPIRTKVRPAMIGINLGLAASPGDGKSADELINNADLALYKAKDLGRNRYQVFDAGIRRSMEQRRRVETLLSAAVQNREFEVHFQPQVRLRDKRLIGSEALLRWRHPQQGLMTPDAFIPTLERSLYASQVGEWVISEACAHAAEMRKLGMREYSVSVNLFDAQLRTDRLVAAVRDALQSAELAPSALHLEITETSILGQSENTLVALRKLRELGVGISFDDYGTGYASLGLLKQFPLTQLKIDRSFVAQVCSDAKDAAVVRAIALLAREFDLSIVAEGIETAAQHAALIRLGCEFGQGYLFGAPMPATHLSQVIRKRLTGQSSAPAAKQDAPKNAENRGPANRIGFLPQ